MFRTASFAFTFALLFAGATQAQTSDGVTARLTPDFRSCTQGADEATWPQVLCYREEQTRQDRRLDQAWANAAKRLPLVLISASIPVAASFFFSSSNKPAH